MTINNSTTNPDLEDEIDDPYIHTVSTEEFVETVERASQEENDEVLTPNNVSAKSAFA